MIAPTSVSTIVLEPHRRCPPNSSGMSVSVAPAALPMPSARWPALRPMAMTKYQRDVVLASTIRFLHDLDADVARGLEAERVDVGGKVEVVVDRLRHVHDVDAAAGLLLELHRRERGVVAADGDELRDVEAQQRDDGVLEVLRDRLVGLAREMPMCEPPRKWMRLTRLDGERHDVVDVALHDPLEAVADAERPRRPRARRGWWRRRSRC